MHNIAQHIQSFILQVCHDVYRLLSPNLLSPQTLPAPDQVWISSPCWAPSKRSSSRAAGDTAADVTRDP